MVTSFSLVLYVMATLTAVLVSATQPAGPLVPRIWDVHTSFTSPSGKVSSSGDYSSLYAAWKAFDNEKNKLWISQVNVQEAWLQYEFNQPTLVTGYRLFTATYSLGTRAPKTWELQVNDGGVWTTIDSRCCETGWAREEERTYYLGTPVEGEAFRLLFLDDNDETATPIYVVAVNEVMFL